MTVLMYKLLREALLHLLIKLLLLKGTKIAYLEHALLAVIRSNTVIRSFNFSISFLCTYFIDFVTCTHICMCIFCLFMLLGLMIVKCGLLFSFCCWKPAQNCDGIGWNSWFAWITCWSEVRSNGSRASWTFGREGALWCSQSSSSYWWIYPYYWRREWNLLYSPWEVARWSFNIFIIIMSLSHLFELQMLITLSSPISLIYLGFPSWEKKI